MATATIVGSAPSAAMSSPNPSPSSAGDRTIHDSHPPNTEPNGSGVPPTADDPFDLPTRLDPNLRQLVEQELELHRKRKAPPR
jgi:hypothetical protein